MHLSCSPTQGGLTCTNNRKMTKDAFSQPIPSTRVTSLSYDAEMKTFYEVEPAAEDGVNPERLRSVLTEAVPELMLTRPSDDANMHG